MYDYRQRGHGLWSLQQLVTYLQCLRDVLRVNVDHTTLTSATTQRDDHQMHHTDAAFMFVLAPDVDLPLPFHSLMM
jgi:hypothetical protein